MRSKHARMNERFHLFLPILNGLAAPNFGVLAAPKLGGAGVDVLDAKLNVELPEAEIDNISIAIVDDQILY